MEPTAENVAKYERLVRCLACRFLQPGENDFEDLVSEGYIGLLRAMRFYDARNVKANFITYAYTSIRRAMLNYFRGWRETIYLAEMDLVESGYDPERVALDKVRCEMLLAKLTPRQREAIVSENLSEFSGSKSNRANCRKRAVEKLRAAVAA